MDASQLPAPLAKTSAPATQPPDSLSGLPQWQRVYLSARAAGADDSRAAKAARSSASTVAEWHAKSQAGLDDGRFARAYAAIVTGVYVAGGPAAVRERHLQHADAILDHFTDVALNQDPDGPVRHRDQISAGDRVLAAVQLTGQGAQASASASVVVRIERPPAYNGVPLRSIEAPATSESTAPAADQTAAERPKPRATAPLDGTPVPIEAPPPPGAGSEQREQR